ncbi:hypothetical protein M0R04_04660 [Candidatus Dojkabacteria bacterium]|jgi:hypothetical protein|nr:hypothetical protein [Candidatus Dojkabacteria bacterium]
MEIVELFEIGVWDGGERNVVKFAFSNQEAAESYKEMPKHKHDTIIKKQIKVYSSLNDYHNNSDEAIKARALSKLTPEEKLVLGLK